MNSNAKGKRGERELAQFLTDRGHPARRGQQYAGSPDSPDVVCPSLPFHIEAKRTERFSLYDALEQAQRDADGQIPLVAHKRNGKDWVAVLRLGDLISLLRDCPTHHTDTDSLYGPKRENP